MKTIFALLELDRQQHRRELLELSQVMRVSYHADKGPYGEFLAALEDEDDGR